MNGINEVAVAQKYLNYAGLQKFWGLAKQFIISQSCQVTAGSNTLVTVDKQDATTEAGAVYTINETGLVTALGNINNEIDTLKKESGVVSVAVSDADDSDYVKISVNAAADANGKAKGDVVITVDATELENSISGINTALETETAARKADVADLAGANWDATNHAWKTDAEPTYSDVTALSNAIDTINSGLVTKVTVVDTNVDDKTNYVEFISNNEAGTGEIVLTVDETALDNAISTLDTAIKTEVTDRTNAINSLKAAADESYDSSVYKTIAKLSSQLVTAEAKIGALTNATSFAGVVAWDPTKVTVGAEAVADGITSYPILSGETEVAKLQNGDIVIFGNKEYILDVNFKTDEVATPKFVELGDTTAEVEHITAIENWINNPITTTEIEALFV